jgi:hypothetical protein
MEVVRITLAEANEYVKRIHRHHRELPGHRFSIAAEKAGEIVGVAICGRPAAKVYDQEQILEVRRLATDGEPNSCSFLYGACYRAAKAMGFERIQTYTLDEESGVSLRAAGWSKVGVTIGGQWVHKGGSKVDGCGAPQGRLPGMETHNRQDAPTGPKARWERLIREQTTEHYAGIYGPGGHPNAKDKPE